MHATLPLFSNKFNIYIINRIEHKKVTKDEIITLAHLFDKISGQLQHFQFQCFIKQLIKITTSMPTLLGGGKHGHAGIIINDIDCTKLFTTAFTILYHPVFYPAYASNNAKVHAKRRRNMSCS